MPKYNWNYETEIYCIIYEEEKLVQEIEPYCKIKYEENTIV